MADIFGHSYNNSSDPNWVLESRTRGTFTVLSTCTVTLGLCIWTAIHLNVPAYHEGKLRRWLRRVEWMVLALFTPELIAYTAYHQRSQAKSLCKVMNSNDGPVSDKTAPSAVRSFHKRLWRRISSFLSRKPIIDEEDPRSTEVADKRWTIIHGFLAVMGGFAIEFPRDARGENDGNGTTKSGTNNFFPKQSSTGTPRTRLILTPNALRFLKRRRFHDLLPDTPKTTIQDKSKGNSFAKALVCIQASWFGLQCVARVSQGLAISLLELNTFGHAICTLLIYFLWFNKPLDVGEPVIITVGRPGAGNDTNNGSDASTELYRLIAAMCVRSKLDGMKEESAFLHAESSGGKAFMFNVTSEDPKKAPFKGKFDMKKAPPNRHEWNDGDSSLMEQVHSPLPSTDYAVTAGLATPFFFIFNKQTVAPNYILRVRHSQLLLDLVRSSSKDATEVIWFDRERDDHWGLVQLKLADNPKMRVYVSNLSQGTHKRFFRLGLEVCHSDISRWLLALEYPSLEEMPRNMLSDRVRNMPRLEDYDHNFSLYLGFGLVGLIYGGLHVLAWNAPFPSTTEKILWRLSSVVVATSGLFVIFLSSWERRPPFWSRLSGLMETMRSFQGLYARFHLLVFNWLNDISLWEQARQLAKGFKISCSRVSGFPGCCLRVQTTDNNQTTTSNIYASIAIWGCLYPLCRVFVTLALTVLFLLKVLFDLATIGFIPLYFLSRAYLVIIAFINIAHLPESAYELPAWSQYLPHIG